MLDYAERKECASSFSPKAETGEIFPRRAGLSAPRLMMAGHRNGIEHGT